jgi:hypothetical protein
VPPTTDPYRHRPTSDLNEAEAIYAEFHDAIARGDRTQVRDLVAARIILCAIEVDADHLVAILEALHARFSGLRVDVVHHVGRAGVAYGLLRVRARDLSCRTDQDVKLDLRGMSRIIIRDAQVVAFDVLVDGLALSGTRQFDAARAR